MDFHVCSSKFAELSWECGGWNEKSKGTDTEVLVLPLVIYPKIVHYLKLQAYLDVKKLFSKILVSLEK